MSIGKSIGKSVVGIGVGEDPGSGVGEGRVSLGLSAGKGSEGYHQLNTETVKSCLVLMRKKND